MTSISTTYLHTCTYVDILKVTITSSQESHRINAGEPQTSWECIQRKSGQGQGWIHVGRVQENCSLQECNSFYFIVLLLTTITSSHSALKWEIIVQQEIQK